MATKTISIPQAGNAKTDEIVDWALKNNLLSSLTISHLASQKNRIMIH